jgi:proteasome activator subunit 4
MLEYGTTRSTYDALRKNYGQARECVQQSSTAGMADTGRSLNRVWPRQKTNSRIIFVKRAQVYHAGRMYMNTLYRRRSALDDRILEDLAEYSLSTYTRVRRYATYVRSEQDAELTTGRQAQSVMTSVFGVSALPRGGEQAS